MPLAALYDIHGNLPALDAVLGEVERSDVDQIVVGGDVVPGPFPRETLARLLSLERPVHFIHGNGELAIRAQLAAPHPDAVTYWGTTSGKPVPEPVLRMFRWTAEQVGSDYERVLARWPKTVALDVGAIGRALFCHATPRSETEIFTRLTPENRLLPVLAGTEASIVACGHTHMQFDRLVGSVRVVNAGSVGQPYGAPGAYWLLLGTDVELRHTPYDLTAAAEQIRASAFPGAGEFANQLLQPPSEDAMLELFSKWSL